jgi:hypothetical protein
VEVNFGSQFHFKAASTVSLDVSAGELAHADLEPGGSADGLIYRASDDAGTLANLLGYDRAERHYFCFPL